MRICKHCIDAFRSRGEKVFIGEMISQDIDYDELTDRWISLFNEPILQCDFCDEVDPELYECE